MSIPRLFSTQHEQVSRLYVQSLATALKKARAQYLQDEAIRSINGKPWSAAFPEAALAWQPQWVFRETGLAQQSSHLLLITARVSSGHHDFRSPGPAQGVALGRYVSDWSNMPVHYRVVSNKWSPSHAG
jgi:hypothetical protein